MVKEPEAKSAPGNASGETRLRVGAIHRRGLAAGNAYMMIPSAGESAWLTYLPA